MEDISSREKLSIRDCAKTSKKYGSTSKYVTRNQHFIKHILSKTDTLPGIALKYGVTTEQIRRSNRLWASDSLFLREHLMIPVPDGTPTTPVSEPTSSSSFDVVSPTDFAESCVSDFLDKIDSSIANTKKEVNKSRRSSEFAAYVDGVEIRRTPVARLKQSVNNNSFSDALATSVVNPGNKVRVSLKNLEKQQDELFEL